MGRIDVRIPAGSPDFETSVSLPALPPLEFQVTKGATANSFSITDRQTPAGRGGTATYRVYFLSSSVAPDLTKLQTADLRAAAIGLATNVFSIEAPGRGTILKADDTRTFGRAGWYLCVAVNERGDEAPVEHIVAAPV